MRFTLLVAFAALISGPALADGNSGTVKSWNPSTLTLVLTDNSQMRLPADLVVPEGLKTGDRIDISYIWKGEDGFGPILSVTRAKS